MSNTHFENSAYSGDPRVIETATGLAFTDSEGTVWYVKTDPGNLRRQWMLINADRTRRIVGYASIDDAAAVLLGPPQSMAAAS